jgi:DNA-binding Lrp family transcriptional regulator
MADALGTGEADVIRRLAALKARGFIVRVGATIRPNTAGASTLAAMSIPEGRIEDVATLVASEPGVNHAYLREDHWNLWFVATAPDATDLHALLDRLAHRTDLRILDLRLKRAFNIDLGFSLSGKRLPPPLPVQLQPALLRADDNPLLQCLSSGMPIVARPYAAIARELNRQEDAVIHRLQELTAGGIVTRLGIIVQHRAMGWQANAMVVWAMPEQQVAQAGPMAAGFPGVTLCYQRSAVPGTWPFTLYNMVHARSREEALDVVAGLRALPEFSGAAHRVLFSTRCFKQTGALLHRREAAA